jgi:addiction module RelE/StbE family toxin
MPNAREDFREIVAYLTDEWADAFAEEFAELLNKKLELLQSHPLMGMQNEQFSSLRQISITKKYTLYYLALREEIIVVNLLHVNRKQGRFPLL